jgi:3-hydroxyisobutyrate dehydrogenase-like beta-hydroxyacid dehydrogenase
MKLGFIGLGKMGSAMVRNLAGAGHELTVYNRTREKAKALAGDRIRIADSAADAARQSEAVFTMLSDDHALAEVVFGQDGIAAGLKRGGIHVSSSTISTAFARHLGEEHSKRGQVPISAPVFGRPEAAEQKKLIVIPAGDAQAIDKLRPAFDAIGRRTFVIGPEPWQANAVKLCGNFMIASMLESFGETFAVMRKSGIDQHLFLDVMNELFGSPVYKSYGSAVADEKFEPAGFALKLALKDVRQAIEAAQEAGVPMPFASIVRDHLVSALANGQEQLDWSSIALVSARAAGLESSAQPRWKSTAAQG